MKTQNLLASVALFSELYNSDSYQNITDILAEFIKGAVVYNQKFSLNSHELKELLEDTYGFNIPESVLRTVLRNRLKDIVTRKDKYYHFNETVKEGNEHIENSFNSINKEQSKLIEDLYK